MFGFDFRQVQVIKVKLKGLNIVEGRKPGTWYVYPRGGGEALIKRFEGSREELLKKLFEPEVMQAYNRPRLQRKLAGSFPIETLGGFPQRPWPLCRR
jgi:hypothetical protein